MDIEQASGWQRYLQYIREDYACVFEKTENGPVLVPYTVWRKNDRWGRQCARHVGIVTNYQDLLALRSPDTDGSDLERQMDNWDEDVEKALHDRDEYLKSWNSKKKKNKKRKKALSPVPPDAHNCAYQATSVWDPTRRVLMTIENPTIPKTSTMMAAHLSGTFCGCTIMPPGVN